MARIAYKSGYKYQLDAPYTCKVAVTPFKHVSTKYIELSTRGELTIHAGYAWDGPSGPTIDTKTFLRGSLVHDVLYQLMRDGWLMSTKWRETADVELRRLCLEDGMWRIRAWWVYRGVRAGGKSSASVSNRKPVLYAPDDRSNDQDDWRDRTG